MPIDPRSGLIVSWENIKQLFPQNVSVAKQAKVTGSWRDESLALSWTTEAGTKGSCSDPDNRANPLNHSEINSSPHPESGMFRFRSAPQPPSGCARQNRRTRAARDSGLSLSA